MTEEKTPTRNAVHRAYQQVGSAAGGEINPSDEYNIRLEKLEAIQKAKIDPYPAKTSDRSFVATVLKDFAELEEKQKDVSLAGRIRNIRLHGGSCFINIQDDSGKIQAYIKKDEVGAKEYERFTDFYDVGDYVYLTGKLFVTKKEEKTLLVKKFILLSKALLPLPEKWHGLSDIEIRFRKRYLDLIANEEVRAVFETRSKTIKFIRQYFDNLGFTEVETPILQSMAGGAIAKPFITHHNALDTDLYLRVAPEIYLKKLIVGGYERVYEIARCFRNEGIDHAHNPEFTQIEFYWAYQDYQQLMVFFENFLSELIKEIAGDYKITYDENEYDFQPPFPRLDFKEEIKKRCKLDIDQFKTKFELKDEVEKLGIKTEKEWGRGKMLDELYKKYIREEEAGPFFIINHPIELSPLAKKLDNNEDYVQRFQCVVAGYEIANAFSELNDPADQDQRFKDQAQLKDEGDDEASDYDAEFVEALKYGMPPTSGLGMGIDRVVQLLTNQHNIKEVILFPTLKPKTDNKED
ncbi:MAG: lysine--tRNA ligase [Candidatus Komeilibacteria bacterium]